MSSDGIPTAAAVMTYQPEDLRLLAHSPRYLWLRASCWVVILTLGALDVWLKRFSMGPDGISYLDIGDAYWRGDWHNAVNAYWSPLYSWILGFFFRLWKPNAYWEFPYVHFVNFLIFVAVFAAFEFFLATFIENHMNGKRSLLLHDLAGIPEPAWWLLGYALFTSAALIMILPSQVTPDMCVAGFVFLASALLVRVRAGAATRRTFIVLGIVLGFGYLAKAVMFALGLVFLVTAFLAGRLSRQSLRNAALAAAAFLAISFPFIAVISHQKHRLTFGDAGRLNYAGCINGATTPYPGNGGRVICEPPATTVVGIDSPSSARDPLLHPIPKIFDDPPTYWFAQPISGSYPFWYDISYWLDGIKPHFDWRSQLHMIRVSLGVDFSLLTTIYLNVVMPLLALLLLSRFPSRFFHHALQHFEVILPSATAVALYALVHTENRYTAVFFCLLWFGAFQALRFERSPQFRRFLIVTSAAITVTTFVFAAKTIVYTAQLAQLSPRYWEAAIALREVGLQPGQEIATITPEPFGGGGAFLARLAKVRVVAQVNQPDRFWSANSSTQAEVLRAFHERGCSGALGWHIANPTAGWRRLGNTEYFFYLFQR